MTRVTAVGEQTSLSWRKKDAGQRMFIGFQGTSVNDDLRRIIQEIQPAGFVLFRRNVEEPRQVFELNRELVSLTHAENPPFLAVDQEGGRVQRIKAPATVWPPMRAVGAAQELTAEVSAAMARELRAMGFNLNFAPVADVDSNPDNPIIGDRSFSNDPESVCKHITQFIQAHQTEGIIACTKHFPGHGDTAIDSHLDLPWVNHDEAVLRRIELPPFIAAIAAGVSTMMTSHVMYPAWDPDYPATLSEPIIRGILRQELGFKGLVFSDDLEMKAVAGRYSVMEQLYKMTNASVDVFLCCESHDVQMDVFRNQVLSLERDENFDILSSASVKRVHALREAYFPKDATERERLYDDAAIGSREHRALVDLVNQRAADNGFS